FLSYLHSFSTRRSSYLDIDVALVMAEALAKLPIGQFVIRINNRKLAEGFYQGIGLDDTAGVLRNIDKLEKIGAAEVAKAMQEERSEEHTSELQSRFDLV